MDDAIALATPSELRHHAGKEDIEEPNRSVKPMKTPSTTPLFPREYDFRADIIVRHGEHSHFRRSPEGYRGNGPKLSCPARHGQLPLSGAMKAPGPLRLPRVQFRQEW